MMRSTWPVLAVLALMTACRSSVAPSASVAARRSGPAANVAGEAGDWRQHVEDLLDDAGDAVEAGADDEFDACAADLFEALDQAKKRPDFGAQDALVVSDALDEVQRLADSMEENAEEAAGEDQEAPPEPEPVPPTKVKEAKEKAGHERHDLPVVVNADVTSLIAYYTGPYRDRFILAMERGSRYLKGIRAQFRAAGLPEDLAFLPLVESAFNPLARSRARAEGLWQFVKGTAALYGLRCDGLVDERNDPILSTKAAVKHLADLHDEFGDWELALAAYNSGDGRVDRALRRGHGARDFWSLRRYLPRETRNYVPAFWAALVVAKDPQSFGLPPWQDTSRCLGRVPVQGALDLDVLAEHVQLTADELADLNPALIHRLTEPRGTYQLAVPCGQEATVAEAIAGIPPSERVRRFIHTVSRGDTLGVLARRYGSSVRTIMAANSIRDPRRLHIGQRLVIPRGRLVAANARVSRSAAHRSTRRTRYVVRRGDTLYDIARRFGVTVPGLKSENALDGSTIRPGDVLRLP
jgi:peptidoglycan lytic transglycosylase D